METRAQLTFQFRNQQSLHLAIGTEIQVAKIIRLWEVNWYICVTN